MFQGLRTVIYNVDDIEKAKAWYSEALGIKPYFASRFMSALMSAVSS